MRRAILAGLAVAVCVAMLGACGSSSGRAVPRPADGSGSSPTSGAHPTAPEASPAGDIPDNQVFVKYSSPAGPYALQVPEGWARTGAGSVTTFTDHFNVIRINAVKSATSPTVTTARVSEVPALGHSVRGFSLASVTEVRRTAGRCVLITYRAESAADPVTGKRVVLDAERYEFWHHGTAVALTLSAPKGSDNVDPWRKVADSFAWSG